MVHLIAPAGQEKTVEEYEARAAWERQQAKILRCEAECRTILAGGHEECAVAYDARAKEIAR